MMDSVQTFCVYLVPVRELMSVKGRKLYDRLTAIKGPVSLDDVCDTVGAIVKSSMLYDFEKANRMYTGLYGGAAIARYEKVQPSSPMLLDVCAGGALFGEEVFNSLGIPRTRASFLPTTVTNSYGEVGHAVLHVASPDGSRIVNVFSASIDCSLARTSEELLSVGVPDEGYDVLEPLVAHEDPFGETLFGDPEEMVTLQPGMQMLPVLFDLCTAPFFKQQIVALRNPGYERDVSEAMLLQQPHNGYKIPLLRNIDLERGFSNVRFPF